MTVHEHEVGKRQQYEFERLRFVDDGDEKPSRTGCREANETVNPAFMRHENGEVGTAIAYCRSDACKAMEMLLPDEIDGDDGKYTEDEGQASDGGLRDPEELDPAVQ